MLHFCLQTVDTVTVRQCFFDGSFVTSAVLQISKTVAVFVLLGGNADEANKNDEWQMAFKYAGRISFTITTVNYYLEWVIYTCSHVP